MKLKEYTDSVEQNFDRNMAKRFGEDAARRGVTEATPALQDILDKLGQTDFTDPTSLSVRIVMLLTVAREVAEALTILDANNPQLQISKHQSDVLANAKASGICISVLVREEAAPPSSASSSSST